MARVSSRRQHWSHLYLPHLSKSLRPKRAPGLCIVITGGDGAKMLASVEQGPVLRTAHLGLRTAYRGLHPYGPVLHPPYCFLQDWATFLYIG